MIALPIDSYLPEITARLAAARSLVLVAEPGAGKTTRVPPALLEGGLLSREHPNLVLLQPRRVAARAAAQRIAAERGWGLGREVGYHVRFDRCLTAATRLRVLTEGILTRQLVDDPFLEGVGCVVLDEFHERSVHSDMALAFLREIRATVRPDLLVVVMSATLEAEPVAQYLGGDQGDRGGCPVIRVPGRTFPIEITHRAATEETGRTTSRKEQFAERVTAALLEVLRSAGSGQTGGDPCGDILVFLPGLEEIRRIMRRLEPLAGNFGLAVTPLHGSLPNREQTLALEPAPPGRRKVILATNIAETSLTIDGVRTVIDSGLARVAGYDAQRGLDRLELKRISRASATQRAGRAGRTAPGRAVRLWSAREDRFLEEFELPEIRRVDLCSTVLALHAWGQREVRKFPFFEAPPEETLAAAERLLAMLGALTAEVGGEITPLGRQLLTLPVHPRIGCLLIAAAGEGLAGEGATLAALLSEKDIVAPAGPGSVPSAVRTTGASDLLLRVELLAEAERAKFAGYLRERGIDPHAARQAAHTRDELRRLAERLGRQGGAAGKHGAADDATLLRLALRAYPDRVVRRRAGDPAAGVMVGGGGVRLAAESVVHQREFYLALEARHDERSAAREALVRIASAIEPGWLEELFGREIRRVKDVAYDAERDRVVPLEQVFYRDLLLAEDRHGALDRQRAAEVLAEAARPRAEEIFREDEASRNLLARVALLRGAMPERAWPAFDAGQLGDLLATATGGKRSLAELREGGLANLLRSALAYPLDRLLDEETPETLTVPSGSRIRLDYSSGQPVLAVRLQELFGWTDTPRIAGGRVGVLLHLLSPGFRPVQITDDLRSFWSRAYFEVRKDLRVRYPKHAWPEDPLRAKAEAKGRPRR